MEEQIIDDVLLNVNGSKYQVLAHKFHIEQTAQNGRPFGKSRSNVFSITVRSHNDMKLMQWSVDSTKMYSGSIQFMSNGSLLSEIAFTDAYCVGYVNEGVYDHVNGKSSITEDILLIPSSFKWGKDAEYKRAA